MNLELRNKNAVVCGSTQGIGKAVAFELANLGANITLVARNEEGLKRVLTDLKTDANQAHGYLRVDFFDAEDVRNKITNFAKSNPHTHILINNTGGPHGGNISEAQTNEFTKAFSQHLVCNQIMVQALLPGMKSEKYGRIINIVSTSVRQPIPGLGVSNTIRGAVASWAKTLATELAPFAITVNNVLPGYTDTPRLHSLIDAIGERTGKSSAEVENDMKYNIPVGRFAQASEIAEAVAFLASPSAAYITGVSLPVDGGRIPCI
jgi:3-oxoacyl-[acyl-carrier protein] reductase